MSMSALESVHNYFERFVFNEISEHYSDKDLSRQEVADMACIALNAIPPKYIRYDIDMSFYTSSHEHQEYEQKIKQAVAQAYQKVISRDYQPDPPEEEND